MEGAIEGEATSQEGRNSNMEKFKYRDGLLLAAAVVLVALVLIPPRDRDGGDSDPVSHEVPEVSIVDQSNLDSDQAIENGQRMIRKAEEAVAAVRKHYDDVQKVTENPEGLVLRTPKSAGSAGLPAGSTAGLKT